MTTSRCVAHRLARRQRTTQQQRTYRWMMPIISPYVDRLAKAALGGHVCQHVELTYEVTAPGRP